MKIKQDQGDSVANEVARAWVEVQEHSYLTLHGCSRVPWMHKERRPMTLVEIVLFLSASTLTCLGIDVEGADGSDLSEGEDDDKEGSNKCEGCKTEIFGVRFMSNIARAGPVSELEELGEVAGQLCETCMSDGTRDISQYSRVEPDGPPAGSDQTDRKRKYMSILRRSAQEYEDSDGTFVPNQKPRGKHDFFGSGGK